MSRAVLSRIYQLSEPFSLAGTAWDFLGTSPSVRRYPDDWRSLLATLEEEFSIDDLMSANIMLTNGGEEPVPSPILSELTRAFICLGREKDGGLYDLVTERGSIMRGEPPCFMARGDAITHDWSKNSQDQLFVVPDVIAVAVFRRLGLPASVATGLSDLDGNRMRQLCGQPKRGRRRESGSVENLSEVHLHRTTLVLLAWDVTSLSIQDPGNMKTIAVRLARIADTFGFTTKNVRLWNPTEIEIHDIALAAEMRDVTLVRAAMRSSLENSQFELLDYVAEADQSEEYGDARRELLQEIERARKLQFRSPELTKKHDRLVQVFEQTCLQPLYEAAHSTVDPAAHSLWLAAAEITEQLHVSSPLLRVAARAGSRDDDPRNDPITPEELKQRRQLTAQLVSIRRELRGKKH